MSETPNQPLDGVEADGAKNIPRPPVSHLAPGDAPCVINPDFTRKEAWEASKRGHLPMTPEIEAGIAAAVLQGIPAHEIARRFGYAPSYAGKLPKQPGVVRRCRESLEQAGLDPDRVAKKLNDLCDAQTTKFFADKGIVMDSRDVADNATQLGAVRTALEVYGAIGQSNAKGSGGGEAAPRLVIVNAEEAVFFGEPMPRRSDGEGNP